MENKTKTRDALISSATAGSFTTIALCVTLNAIYSYAYLREKVETILKVSVIFALINFYASSVTILPRVGEYSMANVLRVQVHVITAFFMFITVICGVLCMYDPEDTLHYAAIPVIILSFITSDIAKKRAYKIIFSPGPSK